MRQNIETAILGMYSAMARAAAAQAANGRADQGRRSAVTSGKHLDPVAGIIRNDLIDLGFHEDEVFHTGAHVRFRDGFVRQRTGICWRLMMVSS